MECLANKNVGISLLRIICSFGIVLCHFYYAEGFLDYFMKLGVPCFMLISFYLMENKTILTGQFLIKRIRRLLIPHIFWSCVYFAAYSIIMKELLWNDLFVGLCTASVLNTSAWFVVVQALLVFIFYMIKKYIKGNNSTIYLLILVGVLSLEYLGIHVKIAEFFSNFRMIIGRTIECTPFACMGIIINKSRIDNNVNKTWLSIPIVIVFFGSYLVYSMDKVAGFTYSGIGLVAGASALFILCVDLLCKRIPEVVKNVVNKIADFTMGIFYIHILIGRILQIVLQNISFHYYIVFPVIVWIVSLCIVVLISNNKRLRMMVK